jgi:transketolase
LPNMTVVAVCDAPEMTRFMRQSVDWPLPIYIRLAKGGDPVVSRDEHGFEIGKAIVMRRGRSPRPVVLMATGVMTTNCLAAADRLAKNGIDTSVVHFHTVKPLDAAAVLEHAAGALAVATVEEGTSIGGFGSAVVDVLVANATNGLPKLIRLGLPDEFPHHYGGQNDLWEYYGLLPHQITAAVEKAIGKSELVA